MKEDLKQMVNIYKPNGIDWMGFEVSENNPYTFHHIKEKHKGGKREISNGAILTKKSHALLNTLCVYYPDAYNDYQELFKRINSSRAPISDEFIEEIYGMLLDLLYHQQYGEIKDVSVVNEPKAEGHVKGKKLPYINRR